MQKEDRAFDGCGCWRLGSSLFWACRTVGDAGYSVARGALCFGRCGYWVDTSLSLARPSLDDSELTSCVVFPRAGAAGDPVGKLMEGTANWMQSRTSTLCLIRR